MQFKAQNKLVLVRHTKSGTNFTGKLQTFITYSEPDGEVNLTYIQSVESEAKKANLFLTLKRIVFKVRNDKGEGGKIKNGIVGNVFETKRKVNAVSLPSLIMCNRKKLRLTCSSFSRCVLLSTRICTYTEQFARYFNNGHHSTIILDFRHRFLSEFFYIFYPFDRKKDTKTIARIARASF